MTDVSSNANPTNLPPQTRKRVSNGTDDFKLLQDDEQTELTSDTPAATAATNSSPFGYSEAQANAILTNLREIRQALIDVGIVKDATAN